ncbi:hypothetical protein RB195_014162 [Necator americanus]|uniref:Reverse transcriptase domain-containing protein n=1 Tax=Necator americanus TaxID=51031 RepID=A0ABR1DZ21_NECAM
MDEETVLKPSNNYSNFLEKSQSLETRENNESLDDLLLGSEAEAADGVNGDDTSPVVVPYTDESDSDISDDEKAESPWEDDAQKQADGTLANLLETANCTVTPRPEFRHSTWISSLTSREGPDRVVHLSGPSLDACLISPKIFTATVENAMRKLECDDVGMKVDGRCLHHLRFPDDIVLITFSINQAERMLIEFDETCGYIGLQLDLRKTMFICSEWVSNAPFTLNGTRISECTSNVYPCWEINMENDPTPELGRRNWAACGA